MPIGRPTTKTIISTTGWGIPITDEVNRLTAEDVTNESRLTALEAATAKTAWTTPTLSNGWVTTPGGVQGMQYRKIGDITYSRGSIANGTTTQNTIVWNIPVGFRSPVTVQLPTMIYLNSAPYWQAGSMDLKSDGTLCVGPGWPVSSLYVPVAFSWSTV